MKKLQNCEVENCIPTPSSCIKWNGGDIEYLGICNGDSINTLLWEVIGKLENITGEDLSNFDIDSLTDICNKKAPNEITILNILNLIRENQICLKDFTDILSEQITNISNEQSINVNLKCYAEFDNLGNSLSITRDELDQLIIDNLCNQKLRIETLEGKAVSLQNQIDNLDIPDMTEQEFNTCIDTVIKPTSSQVVSIANELCDLESSNGNSADISSALSNTAGDINAEFGLITGWILTPSNWAENYSNLLLEVENLRQRIKTIETTCCALTCDDLELGFSSIYNEDASGIILSFTYGAGTVIPSGFTDSGSSGTITDIDGNVVDFNLTIANNSTHEVIIAGLNTTSPLTVKITAKMSTTSLTCQKCLSGVVSQASCGYCEYTAVGGSVTIIYQSTQAFGSQPKVIIQPSTSSTTTLSSSTTTSTTEAA